MNTRLKKALLLALAAILFLGVARVQQSLNRDRDRLGLTRVEPLENAPPMLAFTTVALGGFRGLISNALWMRASDLQDEDKFFEMAQLADWITKLEPHYVQVWLVQAWNMAYNISVKFKDYPDRWRWVRRGIELLRDEGLPLNPNEILMYRELGWFFQHKMGQNLDDAHMYYKQEWSKEMAAVFDKKKPNLDELIEPQTDSARQRAALLRDKYKMDPKFMKQVDTLYGPLEWRLPEAHAIYWAARGLEAARENPSKVKPDDLITVRRVIYQSMQLSFQRGRLISNPIAGAFEFGPNLDIIPKVSRAYEQAAEEDKENHDHILRAHRNFLRDAIYFLYEHHRLVDSGYWYQYMATRYPDRPILDGDTNSLPKNVSLDEYIVRRVSEDVKETDPNRIKALIEGLLKTSYYSMVVDEDERAAGYRLMAEKVWTGYQSRIPQDQAAKDRINVPPVAELDREIRRQMLDPQTGAPPEVRAILRTKLQLPAETNAPPAAASATNPGTDKSSRP
jgi:hypothetical protein